MTGLAALLLHAFWAFERRDKELFLEEVFGGHWTGDAGRDFGHLCR
jgi:hypothetical protein